MSLCIDVDGSLLDLNYLLVDLNGTLSSHGIVIDGVSERLRQIREILEIRLLSADMFGNLDNIAKQLGLSATHAANGEAKRNVIATLGGARCVAIGNGADDAAMLREAALGIAVIGAEGAAGVTLKEADLVTHSITDALDLLLQPRGLTASLRGLGQTSARPR
jgi:P-type E1-E2 ATPase